MARWYSCNVLLPGSQNRQLWQFNPSRGKFNLLREESKLPQEPLPEQLIIKDWQTAFQPKLNVAWLNLDKFYVRVVQLPKVDPAETRSMVELQLEKLCPLPVAQVVWSYVVMGAAPSGGRDSVAGGSEGQEVIDLQTIIVIMVARHYVEEFLGGLEGQGYLADRLELPLVDELDAITDRERDAWFFPAVGGREGVFMVAWWFGGVLQNLSIVHLPAGEKRVSLFREQITQAIWAGELEGWLTGETRFHLVARDTDAEKWLPLFDPERSPEVVAPVEPKELAARTARRVASDDGSTNLLPPEFAGRYKQMFIDRLWMRGLGALLLLYVLAVGVYFGFVEVAKYRFSDVQAQMAEVGPQYTNTLQLRDRLTVLQDTMELQYAALECYNAVAQHLPSELTLEQISFDRGRSVTFFGTAGTADRSKVLDFNSKMAEYQVKNQSFYAKVNPPNSQLTPARNMLNWNFSCELNRTGNNP
jgi:hypothetical protein